MTTEKQKHLNISYYPDEYISSVSPEEAEQLENLPAFSGFYDALYRKSHEN